MAAKQLVLVTGANGGIGFELVSQLLTDASKHVLLGCRSIEKGEAAVKDLKSRNLPGAVETLEIDIDSEYSINAAARKVDRDHGRLDALVNNAAIAMPKGSFPEQLRQCFETNVIGVSLTVEAFVPLLRKSNTTPRIINVSSRQGSIGCRLDPSILGYQVKGTNYRVSKTALNMLTACQVYEYQDDGVKIFAYCPGFTVSNLGPFNKEENGAQPTSKGAAPMVNILNGERDKEHAGFVHENGQYPW